MRPARARAAGGRTSRRARTSPVDRNLHYNDCFRLDACIEALKPDMNKGAPRGQDEPVDGRLDRPEGRQPLTHLARQHPLVHVRI